SNGLRRTSEKCDFPRDTDVLSSICALWITKLRAITAPDHNRENLPWIRFIEIDKGGITATAISIMGADHLTTNCGRSPNVVLRFPCRDRVFGTQKGRPQHYEHDYCSPHRLSWFEAGGKAVAGHFTAM